jgi:uncharacterized protein YkwD
MATCRRVSSGLLLGLALPLAAGAASGGAPRARVDQADPAQRLPPPLEAPWAEPTPTPREKGERLAPETAPTPSFEAQVIDLVNQVRLNANPGPLPPLKDVSELDAASEGHSSSMAVNDFVSHCDLVSMTSPGDRMTAAGYNWNLNRENIAAGYPTPAAVVDGWTNSPGHYMNMTATDVRETGVGYVYQSTDQGNVEFNPDSFDCTADFFNQGPYYHYWTQDFGRRSSVYPVVIDREAPSTTTTSVDLYVYGTGFAQDMRFSNDGSTWSSWETYQADKAWTLAGGAGVKTVYAQIRNGSTVLQASDTIYLDVACTAATTQSLSGQTITGTATYEACDTITAGTGFAVDFPGDVTFRAPHIVLTSGFSVGSGATFVADGSSPP